MSDCYAKPPRHPFEQPCARIHRLRHNPWGPAECQSVVRVSGVGRSWCTEISVKRAQPTFVEGVCVDLPYPRQPRALSAVELNNRWMRENAKQYRGLWVAVRAGELQGYATRFAELMAEHAPSADALIVRVVD